MSRFWVLLGLLWVGGAIANVECRLPVEPLPIPDGATATRKEMADAVARMRTYNSDVEAYLRCLASEADQASVGKDRATGQSLYETRAALHNSAVERLTGLANCLNLELREFKATGGGSKAAEADCTAALTAVHEGAESNAPTTGKVPVTETSGKSSPVSDGGTWDYVLRGGGETQGCPFDSKRPCAINALTVRNPSSRSLECDAKMTYPVKNGASGVTMQRRGVVMARTERAIIRDLSLPAEPVSTFEVTCTERPPVAAPTTPRECSYQIVKSVLLSDYYPPTSRRADEEGPVQLEFTVPGENAQPTDVTVLAGSLFSRLDEAAVRAVQDMSMTTNCPGQRFRFVIGFELQF
jgi:TonB family protein